LWLDLLHQKRKGTQSEGLGTSPLSCFGYEPELLYARICTIEHGRVVLLNKRHN